MAIDDRRLSPDTKVHCEVCGWRGELQHSIMDVDDLARCPDCATHNSDPCPVLTDEGGDEVGFTPMIMVAIECPNPRYMYKST